MIELQPSYELPAKLPRIHQLRSFTEKVAQLRESQPLPHLLQNGRSLQVLCLLLDHMIGVTDNYPDSLLLKTPAVVVEVQQVGQELQLEVGVI